ncbi:MAG: replicative DNA helicase [Desulfovibrionaceae bacterium]|nr:replicative DNA helicase [Desulfovibrionaceae bacterium]
MRRVPPQNLQAEQAVLGGVFLRNETFHTIVDTLGENDFYSPAHAVIFRAFTELYAKNAPIDLVTVAEHLQATGRIDEVGGAVYLAELAQSEISAANAQYYARIVREKSLQRRLITVASEIISSSYEATDVEGLLDEAEKAVFAVSEGSSSSVFQDSKTLLEKAFEDIARRYERKEMVTGVRTHYTRLDEMTAGLQPSDLIILAARPSMGKTAFALNLGMNAAIFENVPTAIFSLEMSSEQLIQRLLCAWGRVDLASLRRGFLDDEDWNRLYDAANALSAAPIFIDDTPALSTMELRSRCRRIKAERGLGLVIVDYLQLMRSSRRTDSRELEISDISRTLKALAKELHVPVIALSQLNRKVEERTNRRPLLSDLRESGAIEQDADVILFLYRDDVYNKRDDNPKKNVAEVIIGKQRNGPTGEVELFFAKRHTRFENLESTYPYNSGSENGGE